MLKALFYFALIYFVFRIYRALSAARVIVKSYHYHDNRSQESREEGKVTIEGEPKSKSGNTLNSDGEYIDYEEVKD